MMSDAGYHIFVTEGDARAEVELLLRELGMEPAAAGFHKTLFVTRANQTVVFLHERDAPLAAALRTRAGWREPGE